MYDESPHVEARPKSSDGGICRPKRAEVVGIAVRNSNKADALGNTEILVRFFIGGRIVRFLLLVSIVVGGVGVGVVSQSRRVTLEPWYVRFWYARGLAIRDDYPTYAMAKQND